MISNGIDFFIFFLTDFSTIHLGAKTIKEYMAATIGIPKKTLGKTKK